MYTKISDLVVVIDLKPIQPPFCPTITLYQTPQKKGNKHIIPPLKEDESISCILNHTITTIILNFLSK